MPSSRQPVLSKNVLMVSSSYPADARDWRGVFIRRIVEALARREDVRLKLWSPPGEAPPNVDLVTTPMEAAWLAELMSAGGVAHLMRTGGLRGLVTPLRLLRMLRNLYRRTPSVDVYHVNWLQNAVPLPRNAAALLTTVLGTDMQLLKLPGMAYFLRRAFRRRKVAICPNAQWMVPLLQERFGDLAMVQYVPFGIEPRWFEIRRDPSRISKWLCVSRLTRGKIGNLFEWGEQHFAKQARELHLFGPMQQDMQVPGWVHYHGAATPDALCQEWFPRARGLITLSQHAEGRPQVMLEAMASGLPVIASRLPAHEDLLGQSSCGYLCDDEESVGLALGALEDDETNREMGERARNFVKTDVGTWDDCANRYFDVYNTLSTT